jgi:hypothetical protein
MKEQVTDVDASGSVWGFCPWLFFVQPRMLHFMISF